MSSIPAALLGRPTWLSSDYIVEVMLLSFFFLSLFRQLTAKLAERNLTKIGHILGNNCNLKSMFKIWGILSRTNRGPKTTFLGRLRNLTAISTAYIFEMKQEIDNWSNALRTTRDLLHCFKKSTNGLKLDLHFYPPSCFIARLRRRRSDQQTELNQTLPNGGW